MFLITSISLLVVIGIWGIIWFRRLKTAVVPEDNIAITANKDGFVKRILPAGRHLLYPTERIEFYLEMKSKLVTDRTTAVVTSDGILIDVNWSGIYQVDPDLITEKRSQRLRGLPNSEKAIRRNVDIALRKLVGDYALQDLFKPTTRERIERQLSQIVAERLKPVGIVLVGLNLQAIDLPGEVAEALNKAKAIVALDGAIRQLDPTTREVVRGAYQLDEILHWDAYLPIPSRLGMKRLGTS